MKLICASLVITLLLPTPASGWSNGTEGCNSFGTHDWILKQAVTAAGPVADWVRSRVSLRATDHASSPWWHVYDRWGSEYGDAHEATAVWFRRTQITAERVSVFCARSWRGNA